MCCVFISLQFDDATGVMYELEVTDKDGMDREIFWEIIRAGKTTRTRYGDKGTPGTENLKAHPSLDAARAYVTKMIKDKGEASTHELASNHTHAHAFTHASKTRTQLTTRTRTLPQHRTQARRATLW